MFKNFETDKIFKFIKPQIRWVTLDVLSSVLNVVIDIMLPFLLRDIINGVISVQKENFIQYIFYVFILVIVGVFIRYICVYSAEQLSAHTLYNMRAEVSEHINRLRISDLQRFHSADIVSRLTADISIFQEFLQNNLAIIIYRPMLIICGVISLLVVSWKMFLFSFVIMTITFYLFSYFHKHVKGYSEQLQGYIAQSNSIIQDFIAGIYVVKAFDLKSVFKEKYKLNVNKVLEKNLQLDKQRSISIMFSLIINIIPTISCIIYGGYLSINGFITAGSFIAFIFLVNYVAQSVAMMPQMINEALISIGAASRIIEILELSVDSSNGSFFNIDFTFAPIEFNNVTFSYNEDRNVLENINFKILNGKTTALVGLSGSGKSSIFKLLCGFYKPNLGSIKLYGEELDKWGIEEARKYISVVPQESYLFPTTISENIGYGKSSALLEEIISAAKIANAHDFIMDLPNGYQTLIGEHGVGLSVGQKQRVAIARAVLKNSPIVLLDEPTSSQDTNSEAILNEALKYFMKESTVLIIDHRLSTVKNVDEILLIDKGQVLEQGNHNQLFEKNNLYKQLYLSQQAL